MATPVVVLLNFVWGFLCGAACLHMMHSRSRRRAYLLRDDLAQFHERVHAVRGDPNSVYDGIAANNLVAALNRTEAIADNFTIAALKLTDYWQAMAYDPRWRRGRSPNDTWAVDDIYNDLFSRLLAHATWAGPMGWARALQFELWPPSRDRLCWSIAAFIEGQDVRSRFHGGSAANCPETGGSA